MKWHVCLLAMSGLWSYTAPLTAQTPSDLAKRFFDAIRVKDAVGLRSLLDPNARVVSIGIAQGTPVVRSVTAAAFVAGASSAAQPWNQRIWNARVLSDENLALIWAPFDFRQDGQLKYCGVLSMQMVRSAAGWRISHLAETQRKTPCPGPP